MKYILKIGTLVLAIFIAICILNHANADSGILKLHVTAGQSTCTYGTSLDLGTHLVSYSAFNMIGNFTGLDGTTTWSCIDLNGLAAWVLNIKSTDLTNSNSQTIPATAISIKTDLNQVTLGSCTTGTAQLSTWTSISTDKAVLQKAGAIGDICTISATNVQLAVAVPASQAVGSYTGTITITLPVGF